MLWSTIEEKAPLFVGSKKQQAYYTYFNIDQDIARMAGNSQSEEAASSQVRIPMVDI